MSQEAVYQLIVGREWPALLDFVYREHERIAGDVLLERAVQTFVAALLEEARVGGPVPAEAIEKLFLLHAGRFYPLSPERLERLVEALVELHAGNPEAAAGYARFCPENARCAAVLARHAASLPEGQAAREGGLRLDVTLPDAPADHTVSLFKSRQEIDFFLAVREVFATYFVYPNVALSCLVDYDGVRDGLGPEARQYFFRGIVDCVVFDQHDGYRPRYFFELDSALHDDPAQQERDRHKERILALAGQKLYRIRRSGERQGREAFLALLRTLAPPPPAP